jgi:hypothetical protein
MGRPKQSSKHRKGRALPPVKLTAAEYELLSGTAKGLGKSVSDFVREAVFAALPAPIPAEVERVGSGPRKVRIRARLRPEDIR